ncbi:MAG: SDR family NAD(P)-dependent oxidoreductase [Synechococcus sp. MED-G71]|jgi:NAD(P)-dependent dehydrogenase (short-subunit alcohol dehydrogenase family)|nr:MAG: SDR family NAD(P)-dependent oxidoreductase [Synechococcus sp. MED-G71]|tara:strand:- start:4800 stop:5516 length:717 start_codon:yes stop_codon:yes gene_type:complete
MSTAPSWESLQGTALVVGQGGIGTALVEALRQRQPQLELLWLGRRSTPRLDLTCDTDLDQLGEVLRGKPPLRLVLNTAGWLHDGQRGPEKRLSRVERAGLEQAFSINAYGAILLARAVESALGHGQSAWFASLSARVGSIGDNRLGGWYGYRAAKAAQNQLLRTLAVEWQRRLPSVCVTLLHPGTTATALSEPFRRGVPPEKLFSAERAAGHLLDVLATQGSDDSGRFLAWDGSTIPW